MLEVPRNFDSICSLETWLSTLATTRHGADYDSLAFINLDDDETAEVMAAVRGGCERLSASELYGPSDTSIRASAGDRYLAKSGFFGTNDASPSEIRLAWILQHCDRYIVERGEVCPTWRTPFPSQPVNTLQAVMSYLQAAVQAWTARDNAGPDDATTTAERWRVLDNVAETCVWLHRRELIGAMPPSGAENRSTFTAGSRALELELWLAEQARTAVSLGNDGSTVQSDGTPRCSVVLRGPTEGPILLGDEVERLTQAQYDIVKVLVDAGERGRSLDELKRFSGHDTAEKTLKRLAKKSSEWGQVILLPGKPHHRYRLLFR